ncbi:hypothetical protein B0H16DRAFT_1601730, partial [Mycena metata]
ILLGLGWCRCILVRDLLLRSSGRCVFCLPLLPVFSSVASSFFGPVTPLLAFLLSLFLPAFLPSLPFASTSY